jgi:hypothetical protein
MFERGIQHCNKTNDWLFVPFVKINSNNSKIRIFALAALQGLHNQARKLAHTEHN